MQYMGPIRANETFFEQGGSRDRHRHTWGQLKFSGGLPIFENTPYRTFFKSSADLVTNFFKIEILKTFLVVFYYTEPQFFQGVPPDIFRGYPLIFLGGVA